MAGRLEASPCVPTLIWNGKKALPILLAKQKGTLQEQITAGAGRFKGVPGSLR